MGYIGEKARGERLPAKLDMCVLLIPDEGATITVDYFNFWNDLPENEQ